MTTLIKYFNNIYMQKLPFKLITKSVSINASKWLRFKEYLAKKGLTFSAWVRQEINKIIK